MKLLQSGGWHSFLSPGLDGEADSDSSCIVMMKDWNARLSDYRIRTGTRITMIGDPVSVRVDVVQGVMMLTAVLTLVMPATDEL